MPRERDMRPAVTSWLTSMGFTVVYESCPYVQGYYCDVVGVRFAVRQGRAIPEALDCMAIELKLSDVAGVIEQAAHNREAVRRSYAAMPTDFIRRMKNRTLDKFHDRGVGLIGVGPLGVEVFIEPVCQPGICSDRVRKLTWRRRFARLGQDEAA